MRNDNRKQYKKRLVNFLFETGTLRRIKRTGWQILGVEEENVAEHSWHAMVIGFVLAKLAKADVSRVVLMLLFHDLAEVRVGDIHKLQGCYIESDEDQAIVDQVHGLPFADEIIKITNEFDKGKTEAVLIAHDSDVLALLVRLKELIDKGDKHAIEWFDGNRDRLYTKQAKELAQYLEQTDSQEWWVNIRKKLHGEYKIKKR